MEEVCPSLLHAHCGLFSDNSPTVGWVTRMAAKGSIVAGQLLRALALRLKYSKCSPLTPQHIGGKKNQMTDIPSRSFGSKKQWFCKNNKELQVMFNKLFPLPNQNSWTVFRPSSAITTKVISMLRMQHSTLDEWRRLPKRGKNIGSTGQAMSNLWDWTLIYRRCPTSGASDQSQDLQRELERVGTGDEAKSELAQSVRRSQPLARQMCWTMASIPQKQSTPKS